MQRTNILTKPVIIVKPQYSFEKHFKKGSKISPSIDGTFPIPLHAGEPCTALSQERVFS